MRCTPEEALKRGWIKPDDLVRPPSSPPAIPEHVSAVTARRKANKREIEGDEQTLLVKEFRLRYPQVGDLLIHIPNGGSRKNAFEGWRMKEQGVRAGVSDLLLPVARGGYFGLWLEFKATPPNNADLSEDQQAWLEAMRAQGYYARACLGVDDAMAILTWYMSLPLTKSPVVVECPIAPLQLKVTRKRAPAAPRKGARRR